MASCGKKTYSEAELKSEIYKCVLEKMLEKTQFLSSEQPCGPKTFNVSLIIAGVERIHSKNMPLRSTLDAI